MSAAAEALQKGIWDALTGHAGLKTAMGGAVRAYDRVPADAVFPYITIPDAQMLDDGDACEPDRFEVFSVLQVWSRPGDATGSREAKRIAHQLRAALHEGLTLTDWNVPIVQCQDTEFLKDQDGVTERARLTFRFSIEPI